jgi:hypothetical protein
LELPTHQTGKLRSLRVTGGVVDDQCRVRLGAFERAPGLPSDQIASHPSCAVLGYLSHPFLRSTNKRYAIASVRAGDFLLHHQLGA